MKTQHKKVGNYILIKELGRGTNGVVYLSYHQTTNQIFAVKAIPQTTLDNPRQKENLRRELKLLSTFKNPNIIKLSTIEKTNNNAYLVLEYCNGGNLSSYLNYYKKLNGKGLSEELAQKVLCQIASGLEYMHLNKTIHRDIKLENILINFNETKNLYSDNTFKEIDPKQGEISTASFKLCDLGFSREIDYDNIASTLCGTPLTMAPDIFLNLDDNYNKSYDEKADLWSFGAIAYELIIGSPSFTGCNYQEVFKKVKKGLYWIPKTMKITKEAIQLINGLLQLDPAKRLTWNEIKSHQFFTKPAESHELIEEYGSDIELSVYEIKIFPDQVVSKEITDPLDDLLNDINMHHDISYHNMNPNENDINDIIIQVNKEPEIENGNEKNGEEVYNINSEEEIKSKENTFTIENSKEDEEENINKIDNDDIQKLKEKEADDNDIVHINEMEWDMVGDLIDEIFDK